MKRSIVLIVALVILVTVFAAMEAAAVGKYTLAYWRECAAYENQSPPAGAMGNHSCYIHVWNENGTPRAGVQLYTSWGVLMGTTDANGYVECTLNRPNGYDFQARDGSNLSDTSPLFNQERAPNWGHYSYEVGFMYKADSANPGTFDTSYDGVLNISSDQPCNLDAPRTRSLAYYSTDPFSLCSDAFSLGNWSTSFGQTFVANGNRVVAARCHPTIGGGGHLWYRATIHVGGPNGAQIGPAATSREVVSDEYAPALVKWGIDDVPVTAGQTYYVKFAEVSGAGMNIYHVDANNYANGQYYENTTGFPNIDLQGMVVCGNTTGGGPTTGTIAGNVKDNSSNNIAGATVSTTSGGYSTTTDSNGNYTLGGVLPGTYSVVAAKTGYFSGTQTGKTVTVGQTTTVNFSLTPEPVPFSSVANKTFEGGFYNDPDTDHQSGNNWHRFSIAGSSKAGGVWGTYHSASWAQSIYESSWTAGIYQQATGASVGNQYTASVWVRGSSNSLKFWVGVDPTGGTNAASANVQWSAESIPSTTWTQISKQVTASAATITMFIKAQNTAAANNYAYIDDADLVDNGGSTTGAISGNVKDGAGANVSGAAVSTTSGGYTTTSDASGNYTLAGVAAGTYSVVASKTGYNSQTQTGKTVTANQTTTVNFTITRQTGTIAGNVKDGGGANVSGATVSTTSGGYTTTTNSSGNYTLSNVATGTYDVAASKAGYNSQTQTGKAVNNAATTTVNFTITAQGAIASESFDSVPSWTSTFDAAWGSAATFSSVAGGQSGNFMQASRTSQGSSARVKVYTVPTNTSITVSVYMKCPSYASSYWMESAFRLGSYTAQDFDANSASWTYIKKFANDGINGNGNTWTQYSVTVNTGSNTQISVGYKHGASGNNGPTVGWDSFLIQ